MGNIFAVQSTHPWRATVQESAGAMGVGVCGVVYERLAQAAPPAYAEYVFGQMCMHAAHERFGSPIITFDEMLERPDSTRRELARWLRGAGDDAPSAGLALESGDCRYGEPVERKPPTNGAAAAVASSKEFAGEGRDGSLLGFAALDEADFRELFYSHAGDFEQQWLEIGAPRWMDALG